jgi:uncharacterized membrane protein YbhN (UPF0104 family)
MKPRRKKQFLGTTVRILICAAALWIVIQGVTLDDHVVLKDGTADLVGKVDDTGDPIIIELSDGQLRTVPRADVATDTDGALRISYGLKAAWYRGTKLLLLLAVAIHIPVIILQALRFQWMFQAQAIPLSYWESLKLSVAGNFLNFATPLGSNAGDVFKAYFVSLHTERKTEAATTVVVDRIIGLGSLILVVAAITTFSRSDSRLAEFRPYMLGTLGAGLAAVFAYHSPTLRKHLVPKAFLERLPVFGHLQRIDSAARNYAAQKMVVVKCVLLTIVLQAMAMGAYFTVAVALGLRANIGNILEYYAYFYTGTVIQALPGPPQGLGTVELAYRYFLAPFGSPSQIVCVAFAIRLVVLTCALPGLLVTLTGSYKPREAVKLHDILDQDETAGSEQNLAATRPTGEIVR